MVAWIEKMDGWMDRKMDGSINRKHMKINRQMVGWMDRKKYIIYINVWMVG